MISIRTLFRIEKLYYLSRRLYLMNLVELAFMVRALNKMINCCDIKPTTIIRKGLKVVHGIGTITGKNVLIGKNCTLYHDVTLGGHNDHVPIIGNNVKIYPHTIIAGNVEVKDNTIIPAKTTIIATKKTIIDNGSFGG